ncbi:MAG: hypothetical protein L0177_01620, partial [Chloroflexi bacterium]|nr:hypothetical protein [Chloroflexota bacterium]
MKSPIVLFSNRQKHLALITAMAILAVVVYVSTGPNARPAHASGPLPGQIMVDPDNPMWLVYNRDSDGDGKLDPFFMAGPGDPEGFLYRGTRNANGTRSGDQLELINKLKGTGANSIYMQGIRSHGGDGGSNENPFNNPSDPNSGINTAILDQWETWFTEMDNNGIVIYFFFYDDAINVSSNLGWPLDGSGNLHPSEKNYVETVVN